MSQSSSSDSVPDFLHKLGLMLPVSVEDVKQAYRAKVKDSHPDAGGTAERFNELQQAFEKALQYAEFRAGRLAWLGAHVERYAQQQALIAELAAHGGTAEVEQLDWLTKSFGEDFAQVIDQVVGLSLRGPQIGDETIALLLSERRVLQSLVWLDLAGSRVTDASVRLLGKFEFLSRLDLRGTPVTRNGLEKVEEFGQLTWLGLPDGALSLWERWQLRWRHPKVHFAAEDDVCKPAERIVSTPPMTY